jgi:hypothetical protein
MAKELKEPYKSIAGVDLTGKTVLLSAKCYRGTEAERLFKCEGGFGCSPITMGRAVFGAWVSDGSKDRVERYEIVGYLPEEEAANG